MKRKSLSSSCEAVKKNSALVYRCKELLKSKIKAKNAAYFKTQAGRK